MSSSSLQTDVLIAGGGPAGLASAIAIRRKGLRVTVAEAASPPVDKACGEGLMPEGVRTLQSLGISISGGIPFQGIRFINGEEKLCAKFPSGLGLAVRRTELHRALAEGARDAGASILWDARVKPFGKAILVNGQPLHCAWLVGADGMNSQVRRWAGLDTEPPAPLRFGFRRHFRAEPWTDYVEVYWGRRSQLFVTPVSASEVCVALLSRRTQPRLEEEIRRFPELVRRLNGALPTSTERGAITSNRHFRVVARQRVALIGDASGSVDAITGEGLSIAFQQAVVLAEALATENLRAYNDDHCCIMRTPTVTAKLLLLLSRHERLRRIALRRLAASPGRFSRVLALHAGALPAAAAEILRACVAMRVS